MRKIGYNFLLIFGLMMTFGLVTTISANGKNDTKRPKNTGILAVKTTPNSYPVLVDGVQVGMSGVGEDALFYLTPGTHRIEVLGPNGKTYTKEITSIKDRKECICLKMVETRIENPCPYNFTVSGPDKITEGDLVTFVAQNNPSPNAKPSGNPIKYVWTVFPETAKITSGLGTDSITIDSTGLGGQTITATVETTDGFYDAQCRQRISVPTEVTPIPPPIPPDEPVLDSFVLRVFDDIKFRLDNYVSALNSVPDSQAYIIIYQGRAAKQPDVNKLSKRILDYMVKVRGWDPRRVQITNGGNREQSMADLWVIKPGGKIPVPTPR